MEMVINDHGNGICGQYNVTITMYFPYDSEEEKVVEAEKVKQVMLQLSR